MKENDNGISGRYKNLAVCVNGAHGMGP